jgi:hypothetical protein
MVTDFMLSQRLTVNTDSSVGSLHHVDVASVFDASEAMSISKTSATLPTSAKCKNPREDLSRHVNMHAVTIPVTSHVCLQHLICK